MRIVDIPECFTMFSLDKFVRLSYNDAGVTLELTNTKLQWRGDESKLNEIFRELSTAIKSANTNPIDPISEIKLDTSYQPKKPSYTAAKTLTFAAVGLIVVSVIAHFVGYLIFP